MEGSMLYRSVIRPRRRVRRPGLHRLAGRVSSRGNTSDVVYAPHPVPLPIRSIRWEEGVRRTGEGHLYMVTSNSISERVDCSIAVDNL
jgi:hypothetical protein